MKKKTSLGKRYVTDSHRPLCFALGGHGKVQSGVSAQHFIDALGPIKRIYCVGSGGGLSPEIAIPSLVVGTKTIEHDYREKFRGEVSLPSFKACPEFLEKSKGYTGREFSTHWGPIASGDEDIVGPKRANELFEQTQALAVGWEGAGVAKAARWNQIPFAEVRSLTDNARFSVAEDFAKNLPGGMQRLAHFLSYVLYDSLFSAPSKS